MHALLAALDDDIRHLPIKRIALLKQFGQFGVRIVGLQQRAIAIMPGALP